MRSAKVFMILIIGVFMMSSIGLAQMNGTYFVDQTASGLDLFANGGTSFQSFNDALDALWANGVSGPVVFEVAGGQTFTENLQIDSTFSGASSTNQIVFRYQGANKPTIQPEVASPAAFGVVDIRFDGDYFLTFEGLKIKANNTGIQMRRAFRVVWGADEITLRNCDLYGFAGEGVVVYWGGGSETGNACENIVIEGNEVFHQDLTSTTQPQVIGIYVDGGDNVTVRGNNIHDLLGGTAETQGIFSSGISDTNDVSIYNNFINIGTGITSDIKIYGILSQHVIGPTIDIYHNSIFINGTVDASTQFTTAVRLTNNAITNFKNNIAYNSRSNTTGTGVHYAMYIGSASLAYTGDYNDLFVDGSVLAYRAGQIADLTAWQTATGQDVNSIEQDPSYIGSGDLHVRPNTPVNNAGTPIAGITTDIDGETRDLTNPEIGADEFPANVAPVITSTAVVDATEELLYNYPVTATDANNGDSLTYSLSVAPEFLSINSSTGLISGTPNNDDVGPHDVTVVVTDLLGLTDDQAYQLTVENVNDAPTISNITDTDTDEETATPAIGFTVGDIDNDPASLTLSGSSSNTAIVPDENITFGGAGANRTVTVTPALNQTGDVDITVTVSDADASANDSFTLTVNPINDAPVITDVPNQTVDEGDSFAAINLNNFVNDVDNLPSELTWNYSGNDELTVNINSETNVAAISIPNSEWNGQEEITFSVADPGLEVDSDPATFTVSAVNDTPVVADIPGESIAEGGDFATINLDDFVTDIDNQPSEIIWSASATTNITVSIVNRVATIAVVDENWNGNESVTFTAANADGASDTDDANFEVTPINDAPVITGQSTLSTAEETELEIVLANLEVSDPDNTYPVGFSLSVQDGENYTRENNAITPVSNFNGALSVPVTVNDGDLDSEVFNLLVSVSSENDAPVITDQDTLSTPEDMELTITLDDLSVTDPDNTYPDDFSLSVQNGENYTREGNMITPVENFNGDLTVPVTVSDGIAASNVFNLLVVVAPVNDAPVIEDQASLSTSEETALTITFDDLTVVDPDNDYPDGFSLSVQDGDNYTREGNEITPVADFNGDLSVMVTVNDGMADSDAYPLVVTVESVNDGPVISGEISPMTFDEDSSLTFSISELLGYVDDPDTPDSLLFFEAYPGANVMATLVDDSLVVFSAPENWNGHDTISVIVSDGELADSALIIFDVKPVNDMPFFVGLPDTVEMFFMAEEEMNLEEFADDNDFNMPGDSLRWEVSVSDDTLKFEFDPETKDLILTAPEYADVFTVTIKVTDDSGATAEGLFNVKVMVDPTGISELANGIPSSYELNQNYPNPFNPTTHIKFGMPNAGDVVLDVYNLLGQKIVTLFDGYKAAGYHVVDFDASNLPTGIYFYRIQSDKFQSVKKMMLVK